MLLSQLREIIDTAIKLEGDLEVSIDAGLAGADSDSTPAIVPIIDEVDGEEKTMFYVIMCLDDALAIDAPKGKH